MEAANRTSLDLALAVPYPAIKRPGIDDQDVWPQRGIEPLRL
jgi:hypothetical protein